jgi:hypothetical protein
MLAKHTNEKYTSMINFVQILGVTIQNRTWMSGMTGFLGYFAACLLNLLIIPGNAIIQPTLAKGIILCPTTP